MEANLEVQLMSNEMFNIRKLKDVALSKLPANDPLRTILLAEKENLTPEEFFAKMEIWLTLLDSRKLNNGR
jgi:hypothetical protein